MTSHYLRALVGLVGTISFIACAPTARAQPGVTQIVAVERVYGDLARQIGGSDVDVITLLDSPTADPHAYEPTPRDADAVAAADIVIVNGLGYDAFAEKLLAASPKASRRTIDVGTLGHHHLGDNPHVWYETSSLRAFSGVLYQEIGKRAPADRSALRQRHDELDAWISRFAKRVTDVGSRHPGARVAITEPVFDYILRQARIAIATPPSFSHAIEEGNDPAPQDVETMRALLANRRVAAFVYNQQTVEPSTTRLLSIASSSHVAVVPVTETLPANETPQQWMEREVSDLDRALKE